jgi:hypothetical protein
MLLGYGAGEACLDEIVSIDDVAGQGAGITA